ncbi:MAG: DUF2809 domain-containing protein [Actinomycetota bacterium]
MKLTFSLKYLFLTLILFAVEVCIALFIKDVLIRPFVGDCLVVVLIYCFFRIFLHISDWKLAFGVFLFACFIEILQYFDYVKLLHLENNRIISVILGRTFEWLDFIAYLTGFLLISAVEKIFQSRENHHNL